MGKKIGFVTIGQSPRDDVLAVMKKYIRGDVEMIERGALDNLELESVLRLSPEPGQPTLVSRMRDGTEVTLTHEKVLPLFREGIDALIEEGAELIVSLCTGEFTEIQSERVEILHPGELVRGVVMPLARGKRLGVVRPSPDQVLEEDLSEEKRWWGAGDVVVTAASPYVEPEARAAQWMRAAHELKEKQVDLVFLNCMGMDGEMKETVRQVTGKPVILASSVVARIVDELIGEGEEAL